MEALPLVEKLKAAFTLYGAQLQYLQKETRFRWCGPDTPSLPTEHGVYCLVSHGGSRIQKIGKAEGKHGLRGRFSGYTGQKTPTKIASDRTDQRWKTVMTGALNGERLSVYYYATAPQMISLPIPRRRIRAQGTGMPLGEVLGEMPVQTSPRRIPEKRPDGDAPATFRLRGLEPSADDPLHLLKHRLDV